MIRLFCSSEVFRDADAAYEPVRKRLESIMIPALKKIETEGVDALIYFIPAIMPPDTALEFEEILRYSKRKNAIEFRPYFQYSEFMAASPADRTKMTATSMQKIIPLIGKLRLSERAACELVQLIIALEGAVSEDNGVSG